MKKFLSILIIAIFAISPLSISVNASSEFTEDSYASSRIFSEEKATEKNSSESFQQKGIKSGIAKLAMYAIASSLRNALPSTLNFLRTIGTPATVINQISSKSNVLASTLDDIAKYFDYYSATIKTIVMQQLQAQGFSFNISYWVAQIVDFVTF